MGVSIMASLVQEQVLCESSWHSGPSCAPPVPRLLVTQSHRWCNTAPTKPLDSKAPLGLLSAPIALHAALAGKQAFGHIHLSGRPEVPVSRDWQALGTLPGLLLPRIPPLRGDKFTSSWCGLTLFLFSSSLVKPERGQN